MAEPSDTQVDALLSELDLLPSGRYWSFEERQELRQAVRDWLRSISAEAGR